MIIIKAESADSAFIIIYLLFITDMFTSVHPHCLRTEPDLRVDDADGSQ